MGIAFMGQNGESSNEEGRDKSLVARLEFPSGEDLGAVHSDIGMTQGQEASGVS